MRYRCSVCDYLYVPDGNEDSDKQSRSRSFWDLPDDWKCPKCGAGKAGFVEVP
jgi:rubredoxin